MRRKGIDVVIGDLDDPGTLDSAFDGVDDLWLLTAMGPRAPENSMNAIWAARRAGVKRVIRMSAVGAAHDALTRNGRLHALSDQEVAQSGLQWTILRPMFFMQNLLGMAGGIAADGVFYLDMGEARLGMIDVRDIALFAANILEDQTDRSRQDLYTQRSEVAVVLNIGTQTPR